MKRLGLTLLAAAVAVMTPVLALAHPGHDFGAHHFANGFVHPFSGLDHIFVMLAVGMWAMQLGGGARWRVPVAFLACMAAGGLLGTTHIELPFAESAILASVAVIGLLVVLSMRLPASGAAVLVGMFA
ncbi:MAG TPA: HupE/UreJ family protein, partial [Tepidisphaeraceae bacterium]|nr:HupE/UreJ family protein [Tepidisphaeraceae bacterium]